VYPIVGVTGATAAAALCVAAILAASELLVSVASVPRSVGPILGIGAAMWMSGMLLRTRKAPARRRTRPLTVGE
jgi:hypothetical protein